jgi:hypothetical protein
VLRKISDVYIRPGEPLKIWFTEQTQDLYIWLSEVDQILKFQFSDDKPDDEKSLLWSTPGKIIHTAVDEGSRPGQYPSSPISLGEVPLDINRVVDLFNQNAEVIPKRYFSFIQSKILSHQTR